MGRYIRLAESQETIRKEGVDQLCPKRRIFRGSVPTISSKKYVGTKGLGPSQTELEKWDPPQVQPTTPAQVRALMSVAVKTAIRVFMSNHVYTFEGKLKVQQEGGSIGASLTVQLSRVVMNFWDSEFKRGVSIELRALNLDLCYVDDILVALVCDLVEGMDRKSLEEKVMASLKKVADKVLDMLQFTFDYPSASAKGWMPCLDVQLKVEDNKILYKYFEKPCCNNYLIMERSAMSDSTKRSSLIQEGLRRLLNTSPLLDMRERIEVLEDFASKMWRSGYGKRKREEAIHGALAAYQCRARLDREGSRPMYRPREFEQEKRELGKAQKRETWFQKRGGGASHESVLFVAATPGSELVKNIEKRLKESKVPVKVAEKSGPKLAQLLVRTDPHREEVCQRKGCMVCETREEDDKGKAKCWQEGVTYSLTCQSCPEDGQAVYIGQTASTAFTRGREHANQYRLSKEGKSAGSSSVMARHAREAHQGDLDTKYKMEVLSCHLNQAHVRQCAEGVRIKEVPEDLLINNKSEGGSDMVTRGSSQVSRGLTGL